MVTVIEHGHVTCSRYESSIGMVDVASIHWNKLTTVESAILRTVEWCESWLMLLLLLEVLVNVVEDWSAS